MYKKGKSSSQSESPGVSLRILQAIKRMSIELLYYKIYIILYNQMNFILKIF